MKIGILTFHNAINYGGVLQAFALQETLKKEGFNVRIIDYQNESIMKSNKLKREVNLYKGAKHRVLKTVYIKTRHLMTNKQWEKKFKQFNDFKKKYLNLTEEKYFSLNEIENLNYDAYISGSDQVWNPNITGGLDPVYFCNFNNKSTKISYAASCGSLHTISGVEKEFLKLVSKLDYISTRESQLAEFISNKGGIDVQQTLDPTLLLNKEDYMSVKKEALIEEPYLLIYKLQENKDIYKIANRIANQNNLKIYEIGFNPIFLKKGINYIQSAGPDEFLGLFEKAKFVVTNSFHGTVFSILFEKNFITIPHRSVGQRMVDLLYKVGLENRLIESYKDLENFNLTDIDFNNAKKIIETEKEKSLQFLKSSLIKF